MISPAGKNNRGFSLFELVLVLLLLGVSMAVVLPNISRGLQDREVRQSALSLAAVARDLRSRALAEGLPQRLLVNLPENSYATARAGDIRLPSDISFVRIVGGEMIEPDRKSFYFFPNGSILGGEIVLADSAKSISYLIRFDALTGKVEVARANSS